MELDKAEMMERLRKTGLWREASKRREEVRKNLKSEGKERAEAVAGAWRAMWEQFGPAVIALENCPPQRFEMHLGGETVRDILDPEYTETEAPKRITAAWFWLAEHFIEVVSDSDSGTVVDFTKASVPPPTPYTVMLTENYAREPDRRREMHSKIHAFAAKSLDAAKTQKGPEPTQQDSEEAKWEKMLVEKMSERDLVQCSPDLKSRNI
jgi:hypothetical protein